MKEPYKSKHTRKDSKKARLFRGKRIIDARAPLTFMVTEPDCKISEPNNPEHCAGAEALRREHPEIVGVYVHRSVVILEYPEHAVRFKTSHPVRDQIVRFDNTGQFAPGTYRLKAVTSREIEMRGEQHSLPDRSRGATDSPFKRKAPIRNLGRTRFHFS